MRLLKENQILLWFILIISVLYSFKFLTETIEPAWDEAYFLAESINNSRLISDGQYSNILKDEHKATIFPLFGSMIYLFTSNDTLMHYLVPWFFLIFLSFYLWRILRLYYDETFSVLILAFLATLPEFLKIYTFYMRDIPFVAFSVASIYYFLINDRDKYCRKGMIFTTLTMLIRPVFSFIYFFIPLVYSLKNKVKDKLGFVAIIGLVIASIMLEVFFHVRNSFPIISLYLTKNALKTIQLVSMLFVIALIIRGKIIGENNKVQSFIFIPLVLFFFYIKEKIALLLLFIQGSVFSGFAKEIGVLNNETASLIDKVINVTISYQFPLLVVLIYFVIVTLKNENSRNRLLLTIYIIGLWIFFFIVKPSEDQRQTLGLFILGFVLAFTVLKDKIINYKYSRQALAILILLNFLFLPLLSDSVFRVKEENGKVYNLVNTLKEKSEPDLRYISLLPLDNSLIDFYRLRYLGVLHGKNWFFFYDSFQSGGLVDRNLEFRIEYLQKHPFIEMTYLLGPIKELNEKDKYNQIGKILMEELPKQEGLNLASKFQVEGFGEFYLFKRSKLK